MDTLNYNNYRKVLTVVLIVVIIFSIIYFISQYSAPYIGSSTLTNNTTITTNVFNSSEATITLRYRGRTITILNNPYYYYNKYRQIFRYRVEDIINNTFEFCDILGFQCNDLKVSIEKVQLNTFLESKKSGFLIPITVPSYIVSFSDQNLIKYTLAYSVYTGIPYVFENTTLDNQISSGKLPKISNITACYVLVNNKPIYETLKNKILNIMHAMGYNIIDDIKPEWDPFNEKYKISLLYDESCVIRFNPVINDVKGMPNIVVDEYKNFYSQSIKVLIYPYSNANNILIRTITLSSLLSLLVSNDLDPSIINPENFIISRDDTIEIFKKAIEEHTVLNHSKITSYNILSVDECFLIYYNFRNDTYWIELYWVIYVTTLDQDGFEHHIPVLINARTGEVLAP